MMRRVRAFKPSCLGLERRVVLSSSVTAAAAAATAGNAAANQAALSAFAREVQQGGLRALTVNFGTPAASSPPGTVVLPAAAYSASLGYGWLSNPSAVQIQDGVASGRSADFEIDVPPGTYDVTVSPVASPNISAGSEVTAFSTGNTIGGPGAFFADPGPAQPVTLRTQVFQTGAGNGLTVAMDGGFAVGSVQITPVQAAGAMGPFTLRQPAPPAGAGLSLSGAHRHSSISGTAQASVFIPEGGTITWDPKNGAAQTQSANTAENWALEFPPTVQGGDLNTTAGASVSGVIDTISNASIKNTGGTLTIHTPQGRLQLVVKGPARTALPFDDLTRSVALTYKIHGGTGAFRGAKGSGTVDVNMTMTGQSVEGTVTEGVLNPSVAEGVLTFTFQTGT
jgi:hypothetical protein